MHFVKDQDIRMDSRGELPQQLQSIRDEKKLRIPPGELLPPGPVAHPMSDGEGRISGHAEELIRNPFRTGNSSNNPRLSHHDIPHSENHLRNSGCFSR